MTSIIKIVFDSKSYIKCMEEKIIQNRIFLVKTKIENMRLMCKCISSYLTP